jgi:hypothetical protein
MRRPIEPGTRPPASEVEGTVRGPLSRRPAPIRDGVTWSWDAQAGHWSARIGVAELRVRAVALGRRTWWEGAVAGLGPRPMKVPGPQYGSADPAKAAAVRLVARLLKTAP